MELHIYKRDIETGLVTYHGPKEWDSRKQLLSYYFRDDECAKTEAMLGWPHAVVTWHGSIGFGEVNS